MTFLDRFFILELRESKMFQFINLKKGNMRVKEYSLEFTQLARYASTMVANSRARMSMFVSGVLKYIVKECKIVILVKEIDFSILMVHAQQIKDKKLKEKERKKKGQNCSFNFSQQRSDRGNHSKFHQKFSSLTQSLASVPVSMFGQDDMD